MSRKFEAKDIEAINKLRIALKEGSSNSGNTLEEASTFDEGGLDEFHHDLLQGEKVTSVRIASHELISVNEDSKEFVVFSHRCRAMKWRWQLSISASESTADSASSTPSTSGSESRSRSTVNFRRRSTTPSSHRRMSRL
jgi:hypothetical protein